MILLAGKLFYFRFRLRNRIFNGNDILHALRLCQQTLKPLQLNIQRLQTVLQISIGLTHIIRGGTLVDHAASGLRPGGAHERIERVLRHPDSIICLGCVAFTALQIAAALCRQLLYALRRRR